MELIEHTHEETTLKLDGIFREPGNFPERLPVKALFRLRNGVYLTGFIATDGTPRIYNLAGNDPFIREDWDGISYWMELPD